jgi:hypothetical protein
MQPHSMTHPHSRQVAAGFLVLILGGGCESGTAPASQRAGAGQPSAIIQIPRRLIYQWPMSRFPPGSFPSGSRVTIKNRHTAALLDDGHWSEAVWTQFQFQPCPRRPADFR